MARLTDRLPADPLDDGAVRPGVRCTGCGYDLRGISRAADCPECGVPIGRTLGRDALHHADPVWLHSLRRGALLMAIPTIGLIFGAGSPLGVAGLWDLVMFDVSDPVEVRFQWHAAGLLVGLLFPIGVWLFTRPEPRAPVRPWQDAARFAARASLLFAWPWGVAAELLLRLEPWPGAGGWAWPLWFLGDAFELIGLLLLITYARLIVQRARPTGDFWGKGGATLTLVYGVGLYLTVRLAVNPVVDPTDHVMGLASIAFLFAIYTLCWAVGALNHIRRVARPTAFLKEGYSS